MNSEDRKVENAGHKGHTLRDVIYENCPEYTNRSGVAWAGGGKIGVIASGDISSGGIWGWMHSIVNTPQPTELCTLKE